MIFLKYRPGVGQELLVTRLNGAIDKADYTIYARFNCYLAHTHLVGEAAPADEKPLVFVIDFEQQPKSSIALPVSLHFVSEWNGWIRCSNRAQLVQELGILANAEEHA